MTQQNDAPQTPRLSYYPNRFFIKSPQPPETENKVGIMFIDGADRPSLKIEYRVKCLDNRWMNLISSDLDTCPLRQRWGKRNRWTISPYTVVDQSEHTINRDGVLQKVRFELRYFMAERAQDDVLGRRRNDRQPIANHRFDCIRRTGDKSGLGGELTPIKDVDPEKMFPHVTYSGQKLSYWYDEAEKSPRIMDQLRSVFQVRVLPNGKLDRTFIPAFNYDRLLVPPTHAQLEKWDSKLPDPAAPEDMLPMRDPSTAQTQSPHTSPRAPTQDPARDKPSPRASGRPVTKPHTYDEMEDAHIPF